MKVVRAIAATLLAASTMTTPKTTQKDFIKVTVGDTEPVAAAETAIEPTHVVIRAGEYEGKAGKRIYVDDDFIVTGDVPLRHDERGYYIHEYDLNVKMAKRINEYLKEYGANTSLQISGSKKEDLNAAGRIAKTKNPTIYYSVHHNYVDNQNVSGYVAFTNPGDTNSMKYAQALSNTLKSNPAGIKDMGTRVQDNYIGEMNQKPGDVNILMEYGFFSNINGDLKAAMDDEHVDYMARETAKALIDILKTENAL